MIIYHFALGNGNIRVCSFDEDGEGYPSNTRDSLSAVIRRDDIVTHLQDLYRYEEW